MVELNALADAVHEPPPQTFRLHPRLVLLYSRKLGITPGEYRVELWRQHAVMASPTGRRLYRELEAIEARYAHDPDRQP